MLFIEKMSAGDYKETLERFETLVKNIQRKRYEKMILFKEDDKCARMILKSIAMLIAYAFGGLLALLLVYSFPREKMKENVLENADFYSDSHTLVDGYRSTRLSIFTDNIMFTEAICPSVENILSDVLLVPRRHVLDGGVTATYTCEDETLIEYEQYPRYWHGYLVILKPLLILFNISDLYMICFFVQSILLILILIGLAKRNQAPIAICFGIGMLALNPIVTGLNFQNASIYFTILLSILFLLYSGKFEEDYLIKKQCLVFFQVVGMSVAYFDFLTYPIAALGVPLLFLLYFSDTKDIKKRIVYVILHSVMFFVGYFGMYFCKWGLATFFTDVNVFKDAYNEIMIMLNAGEVEGAEITIAAGIARNLSHYLQPAYLLLIIGGIMFSVIVSMKFKPTSVWVCRNISAIIVGLYPFCHMFASAHSYFHHYFVHREFVVTLLAVLFIILDIKKCDGVSYSKL